MSDRSKIGKDEALRALVALSAARSFSLNTNNPLEVVVPLFQPIATAYHGKLFNAEELARELAERYDLLVSEELAQYWQTKLRELKLLVPASGLHTTGGYIWDQQAAASSPDGEFAAELTEILRHLRDFLNSSHDLIMSAYTDDDLARILRDGSIGSLFPRLYDRVGGNRPGAAQSDDSYLFNRFVQHINLQAPHVTESITRLRRAAIYCDLIIHLPAPRKPPVNSQPVCVYLDSPLALDVIGLGGRTRKEFAERLLAGFKTLHFEALISPDMIFEARNSLRALLDRTANQRYGPTANALRRAEFKDSFVEASRDRLEGLVEESGIRIDRSFESHIQASRITAAIGEQLLSRLQSHYQHIEAAIRDVSSIRGAFGRRGVSPPNDLYSARSLFLTSNTMLSFIVNRFIRETMGYQEKHFPVVVTRATCSALTDAIVGVKTSGNLSLKELLISAADATQYNNEITLKIEKELREIAPNEADELLRILERPDYSSLAMDIVRGSSTNVTAQTAAEVVQSIKTKLELEAEEKVKRNRKIERSRADEIATSAKLDLIVKDEVIEKTIDAARVLHDAIVADARRRLDEISATGRKARTFQKIAAISLALFAAFVTYIAIYYVDALAKQPGCRLLIAMAAAVITGAPMLGLPSPGRWLESKFTAAKSVALRDHLTAAGYTIQEIDCHHDETLISELSRQFESRISATKLPSRGGQPPGNLL